MIELREQLDRLRNSRPDQLLLGFGLGCFAVTLAALWIDLRLGIAALALLVTVAYAIIVLLLRVQQRKQWVHYRQLEALQQLTSLLAFRLPLPAMREGAASPDLLLLLCREILARRPRSVVECGAGVSTLLIGYALEKTGQGQLLTLEHDPLWAERVKQWLIQHGLDQRVQIIYAPLAQQSGEDSPELGGSYEWYAADAYLPALTTRPPIDLLFVDGPPDYRQTHARLPAVPLLRQRLSPDCVIVMDDTARRAEAQAARVWAKALNYRLDFFPHFDSGAALLQPMPKPGSQSRQEP